MAGNTMRAIRYHETGTVDVLNLEEAPRPEAGEDEVLVRVHAAGVNGNDSTSRRGQYGSRPLPAIPGSNLADLEPGQRVLVHGAAGGVGAYVVQLAKWKGAEVIGTASAANVDFVRSLGADTVIDYNATRFESSVRDADMVYVAGGEDTIE